MEKQTKYESDPNADKGGGGQKIQKICIHPTWKLTWPVLRRNGKVLKIARILRHGEREDTQRNVHKIKCSRNLHVVEGARSSRRISSLIPIKMAENGRVFAALI